MHTLAVIVGSLRKESMNKQLADNLARLGKDLFTCNFVDLGDVPMLNQDLEADLPAGVVRLKQSIKDSDAVLLVTPEYNRSIPPLMKNAIDWASRPYGQNSCRANPRPSPVSPPAMWAPPRPRPARAASSLFWA